ncbi:hypothetical protein QE400_001274 [Xanthomonas sacchari]|uniref:hypothetical protein n=1 Tax=Xanthomonas sacchari TaxID=56458 RepID=UPI0020C54FC9|nr:hypothetical protein [Xanthomonas sacchari]MDQ1091861.1 hypothetical protein [Xanthomonas sacchari]
MLVVIGATYGFVQYVEVKPLQRQLAEAKAAACKREAAASPALMTLLQGESRALWDGALTVSNLTRATDGATAHLRATPRGGAAVDKAGLAPGDSLVVRAAGNRSYVIYLNRNSAGMIELTVVRRP